MIMRELERDQEKSSSGKKFESPKKSNFFPVELFSSKFFWVHMEPDVLQQWQTTHFKACSKSWRMGWKTSMIQLKLTKKIYVRVERYSSVFSVQINKST